MSSPGPLSGITFSGIGSGIDTASIVDRLVQLEKIPLNRLQAQKNAIAAKQTVYQQLRNAVNAFRLAGAALNESSAYNPVKATSSDEQVARIVGGSTAAAGSYTLKVSRLAQTHKVASSAQNALDAPLGFAGAFAVNGKSVSVEASDTLSAIASKLNSLNVGVTASIIDGGPGKAHLTLTATQSGANARIALADLQGGVAASLGLVSGPEAIRELEGFSAWGLASTSSSEPISNTLGASPAGTVLVNGTSIALDLGTDSLDSVAAKINAAGAGVSASVVAEGAGSETRYRLKIDGGASAPTFQDSNGVLAGLGLVQQSFGHEVVAAADASYSLDGIALQSATNVVTNVIPGAAITLVAGDETEPKTTRIEMTRDVSKVVDVVKAFQTAYNDVISVVKSNSNFDSTTYETGLLFGDPLASQVQSEMANLMMEVRGQGTYRSLTDVGFGLDENGKLTLDSSALNKALESKPEDVRKMLMSTGTPDSSALSYIASTVKTEPTASPYDVVITQLATKSLTRSLFVHSGSNVAGEKLTFSGPAFGATVDLVVDQGSSLDDLILKINQDSRLRSRVVASNDGGKLKIESLRYGTQGNFTVKSNLAAAADNSGIGIDGGASMLGVDVDGTIDGAEAVGSGQFLTASAGKAEGLQLLFSGSSLGLAGRVGFYRGVAAEIDLRLTALTDSSQGVFSSNDKTLSDQIADIDRQIVATQASIASKEAELKTKFAAMDQAVAAMNNQMSSLSSMLAGMVSSTK